MTLTIALIGFGARVGLAREIAASPTDATVTIICDVDEASRERATAEYPNATVVASIADVISAAPDAAMVLTPDDTHAAVAIPLLEAGITVFCEKPLAIALDDADAILEAAYRTGSRLYVGHNMRHMPVISLMRQLITDGAIGEVKAVWCRHFVGHGGDFYFKDWHADRSRSTGLLLQKGTHDLDVIHWLAGSFTRRVSAMGSLLVYGDIPDRQDRSGQRMQDWFSVDNWPPTSLQGLNPVIDVEDVSMVHMQLESGVLASYEQCHFTPDYWRNYTVIGTEGRLENLGDTAGSTIAVWNKRHRGTAEPDEQFVVPEVSDAGHDGADALLIAEFLRFAIDGGVTQTSPVAAREAVATGVLATQSLRSGSTPMIVPALDPELVSYFERGQVGA